MPHQRTIVNAYCHIVFNHCVSWHEILLKYSRLCLLSPLSHLNRAWHQFVLVVLCNYAILLDLIGPAISSTIQVSRRIEQLNAFLLKCISRIQTLSKKASSSQQEV